MTGRTIIALGTAAILASGAIGFTLGWLTTSDPSTGEPPAVVGEGRLAALPDGPVGVRAERVVLPAGFFSKHRHGGPTFNFVDAGVVDIEVDGERNRYEAGGFFFEPGGRIHSITVLDETRLSVLRLLPPGAAATTEVP
jgi:quercetin dioxygenase-like cupin family protein